MSLEIAVVLALATLPIVFAIRVVPETERFVVLRLGRIYKILEPGLRSIVPGVDRVVRVDLNRAVPDWQSLSESDLQARIRQLAASGQLPPSTT